MLFTKADCLGLCLLTAGALLVVGCSVHEWAQRRRLRARLPSLSCPACNRTFGERVITSMSCRSVWPNPGRAYEAIRVRCPHCTATPSYRLNGKLDDPGDDEGDDDVTAPRG